MITFDEDHTIADKEHTSEIPHRIFACSPLAANFTGFLGGSELGVTR